MSGDDAERRRRQAYERQRTAQLRRGLELTPAQRLRWLEETMATMRRWLGRARRT